MTCGVSVGSPRRINPFNYKLNMNLTNKVLGLSLAAVVGFASSTIADDSGGKASKKSLESRIAELEAKLKDAGAGGGVKGSGIKVSGYVDTSYLVNLADRDNSGPVAGASAQNTARAFDNQYNSFNLNAVKLTIEKEKDTSKFPAGFRIDTIYGEDAAIIKGARASHNTGAAGAQVTDTGNDSEFALEQAYIDLGLPLGNGIDLKFGKMVTLIGYEVIESPANWQFSRSDAFRIAPMTQTGATLGYQWNDWLTSTVGVINGIDSALNGGATANSSIIGSGNRNTDFSFIGRLDFKAPKTAIGDFNAFVAGLVGGDIAGPVTTVGAVASATTENGAGSHIWNIGGNWDKPFNVKPLGLGLEYLYRNDTLNNLAAPAGGPTSYATIDASAINGYAKWDWNKWLTTSGRLGYSWYGNATQRNLAGVITGQQSLGALTLPNSNAFIPNHTDMFSFTLTQAFNVWKDTLVRLEWRRDWTDTKAVGLGAAGGTTSLDDIRNTQDTLALNLVYSF